MLLTRPRHALYLAASLLLFGCATTDVRDFRQASDTHQLTESEDRIWHQGDRLDKTLRHRGMVFDDAATQAYLQSIMDRLFPEFAGTIKVYVGNSSQLNAFALPNGSVYINLGLLVRMQNEAQLAMVLGHEAAHFIEQHSLRMRGSADSAAVASTAITVLTGIPFSGQLIAAGAMSGYSQGFERAADRLGFTRLVGSGYAPAEAAGVFRIMREEVIALDIDQPFLYSSHPKLSERVDTLEAMAATSPVADGRTGRQAFEAAILPLRAQLLKMYLREHDHERLILVLEDPERRQRYPAYAGYFLGEAYRLRDDEGDTDRARAVYAASIHEAPTFAGNYRALGLLAMKRGDNAQAIDYLQRYRTLAPDAGDAVFVDSYLKHLKGQL